MFLDDELFQICSEFDGLTPESIQELNRTLCGKCDEYRNKHIYANMPKKEVKTVLDRTFNLFDSFVMNLRKSDINKNIILADLFEKYSYKNQFLSDEKMSELYESLKG